MWCCFKARLIGSFYSCVFGFYRFLMIATTLGFIVCYVYVILYKKTYLFIFFTILVNIFSKFKPSELLLDIFISFRHSGYRFIFLALTWIFLQKSHSPVVTWTSCVHTESEAQSGSSPPKPATDAAHGTRLPDLHGRHGPRDRLVLRRRPQQATGSSSGLAHGGGGGKEKKKIK